jgi:hypothetical protein
MCRKRFGSFSGAFAALPPDRLRITRGDPGRFRSPPEAARGFGRDCRRTPPSCRAAAGRRIGAPIASRDRHAAVTPPAPCGIEACAPCLAELPFLPQVATGEGGNGAGATPGRFARIPLPGRRHPDHDIASGPPA